MLVSARTRGRCRALHWDGMQHQYRCRLLTRPEALLRWLPSPASQWFSRLARRWISSGSGCDANLQSLPERR
jgi:hypothetical protein